MSYGNYALLVLKAQYDFLEGAEHTLVHIRNLVSEASLVVAVREWHPENHFSFDDVGPHAVEGSKGARIHTSVRKYANFVISMGTNRNPPDAYSAFAGKTLRPVLLLEEILWNASVQTVVVTGQSPDIEVKYTALDANALGYRTVVPLDCTTALDDNTLAAFKRAGVETVEHFYV